LSNQSSTTSLQKNHQPYSSNDLMSPIFNKIMPVNPVNKNENYGMHTTKVVNTTLNIQGSNNKKFMNDFDQYLSVKEDRITPINTNTMNTLNTMNTINTMNNYKSINSGPAIYSPTNHTPNGNNPKNFSFDPSIYLNNNNSNNNNGSASKYSNNSRNTSIERERVDTKVKQLPVNSNSSNVSKPAKRVNSSIPLANTQKNSNNKNINYNTTANTVKANYTNYSNFDSERSGNYNNRNQSPSVGNKVNSKYSTLLSNNKERSTTPISYNYNNKKSVNKY